MKDETIITISAITAIIILEAVALIKGINGALFGLVIAAVAGLAGYEIKKIQSNG